MDRAVSRRDFLSGVGIGLTGSILYPWANAYGAPDYPPGKLGMRGSHAGSFETAHALTRGETWNAPEEPEEGAEEYDLIVSDGVIFAGKRVEITDKILERLRADFKKSSQ